MRIPIKQTLIGCPINIIKIRLRIRNWLVIYSIGIHVKSYSFSYKDFNVIISNIILFQKISGHVTEIIFLYDNIKCKNSTKTFFYFNDKQWQQRYLQQRKWQGSFFVLFRMFYMFFIVGYNDMDEAVHIIAVSWCFHQNTSL